MTNEVYLAFLVCSGDTNPLHYNDEYARTLGYSGKLMHGALLNAMISGLVGTALPVRDTMCLMQKVNYRKPFFLNETVDLTATVDSIQEAGIKDKWVIMLKLKFQVNSNTIANGMAEVLIGCE